MLRRRPRSRPADSASWPFGADLHARRSQSTTTEGAAVRGRWAAAARAAAQQAAERAAIDRTLSYAPVIQMAGAQHPEIALTFDDGPGPYTPQVLSVLEREGAPATFFEVGTQVHYFHAGTSQILADG